MEIYKYICDDKTSAALFSFFFYANSITQRNVDATADDDGDDNESRLRGETFS